MKTPSSQRLLPLFRENPKEQKSLPELFEKAEIPDAPENVRRLKCSLGHVGRRLLFDDKQLLLHDADGYWIAQPRVDRAAVEKRLWSRLTRDNSSSKRTLLEVQVAEDRHLISEDRLRAMKSSIYFAKASRGM